MITNQRVKIGGFLLGQNLKMKFKDYVTFTSDERPEDPSIKMHAGIYFHAQNVWQPEVGDIRVHFSYAGKDGDLVMQYYFPSSSSIPTLFFTIFISSLYRLQW